MPVLPLSAVFLLSAPLWAADYNINKGDGAVDFGTLTGSYSFPDNIYINGPSSGALGEGDYVEISDNLAMNGRTLHLRTGAVARGVGGYAVGSGGINVYNGTDPAQGTTSLILGGEDSSKRLSLSLTAESNVGKDGASGSSLLEFAGYTTVTTGTNIRLDVGNTHNVSSKSAGNATLRVSGTDNNLTIYSLNVGDQEGGAISGASMLEIVGSTHSIRAVAAFRLTGGSGTSADNIIGGVVSFVADADGVSAINVGSVTQSLTGVMLLDLTDFAVAPGSYDLLLISYDSSLKDTYASWASKQDSLFRATGANGDVTLQARDDGLYAVYAAIPEPGACAALLGALSLALAAYRRRGQPFAFAKNNI